MGDSTAGLDARHRRVEDPCGKRTGCDSVELSPRDHSVARILLRMSLRVLIVMGLVSFAILTGCDESPLQTAPDSDFATLRPAGVGLPRAQAAASPTMAPPLGVGGSYTMTAGGEKITGLPIAGTGIRLPEGLPVRVRVSGAITRTATAGLKEFCALPKWAASCQGVWADIVAEDPIPPSGPSFWLGAGAALVAWDGGGGLPPPEGSRIAFSGTSGSELWAGRSEWGCYYFDSQEIQGPCFTFGGSYTVTVETDDGGTPNDTASAGGSGGESQDAQLLASATLSGGTVHLQATTDDGSPVGDPSWVFIPDEVRTVNGDTTAPAPASPIAAAAPGGRSGGHAGMDGIEQIESKGWRLPDGRTVGPGLYVWRKGKPATTSPGAGGGIASKLGLSGSGTASSGSVAMAPEELDECALLAECTTTAPRGSGTYIVVAQV